MSTPDTLHVWVNQKPLTLAGGATLADAVAALPIKPPFAAAINLQFVPQAHYQQTALHDGDHIDLIAPVVGG